MGKLQVTLIAARDLKGHDTFSKIDPFVKLEVGSKNFKSRTVDNSENPNYNEEFTFFIADPNRDKMSVTVLDKDLFSSDHVGSAELALNALPKGQKHERWLTIVNKKGEVSGTVGLIFLAVDFGTAAAAASCPHHQSPQGSSPAQANPYASQAGAYQPMPGAYPPPQSAYPPPSQGAYPPPPQAAQAGGYGSPPNAAAGAYPPPNGYPPMNSGYGGYPPPQTAYAPPQTAYPPPQGAYPPPQSAYPPPPGAYPPPQSAYPPPSQFGGYPGGGAYPPPQPPTYPPPLYPASQQYPQSYTGPYPPPPADPYQQQQGGYLQPSSSIGGVGFM
jgi:hypothetical protein